MDGGELTGAERDRRLRKKEKDNAEAQSTQRSAEKGKEEKRRVCDVGS